MEKTPSQIAHVHIRSDLHAIAHFPLRGPFNFVTITFIPPITNKGANVCDYTKLHHHHLQPLPLSSSPIVFFFISLFFLLLLSHVAGRRVSEQVKSKCQRLNAHSSSSLLQQQQHRVRSNTRSSNATTLLCCALMWGLVGRLLLLWCCCRCCLTAMTIASNGSATDTEDKFEHF